MSIVSNRHTIVPLKGAKPMMGQELLRIVAKKDKDGNYNVNLTESMAVSVPKITQEEIASCIPALMPHILSILKDAREEIVREQIIMHGIREISSEAINVTACIEQLESGPVRMTSELMKEWFTESYGEIAMEWIAVKGFKFDPNALTTEQATRIEQSFNVLRDMFAGYAGAKYAPKMEILRSMNRFVQYLGDAIDVRMQVIAKKITARIQQLENETSMNALGFDVE